MAKVALVCIISPVVAQLHLHILSSRPQFRVNEWVVRLYNHLREKKKLLDLGKTLNQILTKIQDMIFGNTHAHKSNG